MSYFSDCPQRRERLPAPSRLEPALFSAPLLSSPPPSPPPPTSHYSGRDRPTRRVSTEAGCLGLDQARLSWEGRGGEGLSLRPTGDTVGSGPDPEARGTSGAPGRRGSVVSDARESQGWGVVVLGTEVLRGEGPGGSGPNRGSGHSSTPAAAPGTLSATGEGAEAEAAEVGPVLSGRAAGGYRPGPRAGVPRRRRGG